jgi:hypothetical protein
MARESSSTSATELACSGFTVKPVIGTRPKFAMPTQKTARRSTVQAMR